MKDLSDIEDGFALKGQRENARARGKKARRCLASTQFYRHRKTYLQQIHIVAKGASGYFELLVSLPQHSGR
jgi:hypothetical protein